MFYDPDWIYQDKPEKQFPNITGLSTPDIDGDTPWHQKKVEPIRSAIELAPAPKQPMVLAPPEEPAPFTPYNQRHFNNIVEKQKYWDALVPKYGEGVRKRQDYLDRFTAVIPGRSASDYRFDIKTDDYTDYPVDLAEIKQQYNAAYKYGKGWDEYLQQKAPNLNQMDDYTEAGKIYSRLYKEFFDPIRQHETQFYEHPSNKVSGEQKPTTWQDITTKTYPENPYLIYASMMDEGGIAPWLYSNEQMVDMGMGSLDGTGKNMISSFQSFGMDTVGEHLDDFIKKGYLPEDFKSRVAISPQTQESGRTYKSVKLTSFDDVAAIKRAYLLDGRDRVQKIAQDVGINLSNRDDMDYWTLVSFNYSDDKAVRDMMQSYKDKGVLDDQKYLKNYNIQSIGGDYPQVHRIALRKLQSARMLEGEFEPPKQKKDELANNAPPSLMCGGILKDKYPKAQNGIMIEDMSDIFGPSHARGGVDMQRNGVKFEAEGGETELKLADGRVVILNQQQKAALDNGVPLEDIMKTLPEYTPKAQSGLVIDPDWVLQQARNEANRQKEIDLGWRTPDGSIKRGNPNIFPYPWVMDEDPYRKDIDATVPTTDVRDLVSLEDYNPETGYIKGSPGDIAAQQQRAAQGQQPIAQQPGTNGQQTTTSSQIGHTKTTQSQVTPQQPAPQKSGPPSSYEEYLKIFQSTLPQEPELDKKRRNQLALVAMINALGQGVKQVVDYHGRTKHNAPIQQQYDPTALQMLGEYEKVNDEYKRNKAAYDAQRSGAMMEAFKYAYMDDADRKKYEQQLDLLGRQQQFTADEATKERTWRTGEREGEQGWRSGEADKLTEAQKARDKAMHGYDLEALNKKFNYDMALLKEQLKNKGGSGSGQPNWMENMPYWEVIDGQAGKTIPLDQAMFWDVLSKELKALNMGDDANIWMLDGKPSEGYDTKEAQAKAIVTGAWNKYWKPIYDDKGALAGWEDATRVVPPSPPWEQGDTTGTSAPGGFTPGWQPNAR